jgi:peptide-methionine (R)-S-oxide reductase
VSDDAKSCWQDTLAPEEYRVTRCGGTEAPFTGRYWDTKTPGTYHCVCCDVALFASTTKYASGSGWPSFWQPIAEGVVAEHRDVSHGMVRVEVLCAGCDGHLGHVFPDGPQPTGLRYCINSASLRLEASDT